MGEMVAMLKNNSVYAGSDGSVKDGCSAHAYDFTSGISEGGIWGGLAITTGSNQEMSSLRADHGGTVGILLIIYSIQIYVGHDVNTTDYTIKIWLDNAEVLARGGPKSAGYLLKSRWYLITT